MGKAVGERLRETALKSRSAAYQWLHANHAEIAAEFARQPQPAWMALMRTAAGEGITLTAAALRKTWPRVLRDLAREAQTPAKPAPVAPSAQPVAAPVMSRPLPPSAATEVALGSYDQDERPRARIPIRLRPPTPLAEGEAWPDDGSRLPAPLRPTRKS